MYKLFNKHIEAAERIYDSLESTILDSEHYNEFQDSNYDMHLVNTFLTHIIKEKLFKLLDEMSY